MMREINLIVWKTSLEDYLFCFLVESKELQHWVCYIKSKVIDNAKKISEDNFIHKKLSPKTIRNYVPVDSRHIIYLKEKFVKKLNQKYGEPILKKIWYYENKNIS